LEVILVRILELSIPEFAFIVATRAAMAAGLGLLASAGLRRRERRLLGLALLGVGAVTTVPAVLALRRALSPPRSDDFDSSRTAGTAL
jgi:hypothetical protein